jgi:hypothetical protein
MMIPCLLKRSVPIAVMGTTLGLLGVSFGDTPDAKDQDDLKTDHDMLRFNMKVSDGASKCLSKAGAQVAVRSLGPVEKMNVEVSGLPPDTEFDFFIIQVPKAPFGMSWYQGDIKTDKAGRGSAEFIGRFSIETFIVAPVAGTKGVAAPDVHKKPPFPDATINPTTNPIHTFHLGLWFNSPYDAKKAGCADTVTPFNGTHNAGIQVLNTANFKDLEGPLSKLKP